MAGPSNVLFRDFNITFSNHPISGDLAMLENEAAVKRAIKNLVFTRFYERPFQPELGSDVLSYLFENFSPITAQGISKSIEEVIHNHEPRAELIDVFTEPFEDQNRLEVTIVFRVVNQVNPTTLSVFLERTR